MNTPFYGFKAWLGVLVVAVFGMFPLSSAWARAEWSLLWLFINPLG